ncbi:Outer membrane protein OmpA [Chitinophaga sp. CF118]|uniref:OmpA family protein n=1 Tax=Chitinophaga sp. CF118 TaxID=1884367 RepID=UPI0008EB96BE|nr:OmpA family protein [Chitinophaga sp. CF118]SFE97186.1 Outer membrane protein OmpA [Chitinophaga sp. CF118]
MKKLLFTAVMLAVVQVAWSQHKAGYLKAADSYYRQADYYSASLYYEKYLVTGTKQASPYTYNPYAAPGPSDRVTTGPAADEQQAVYQLADSYRRLNDLGKAAPLYEKTLTYNNNRYPLAAYYYGICLRSIEKYDAAEEVLSAFLAKYTATDNYSLAAEKELRNLRFIRQQLKKDDLSLYHLHKAAGTLNAGGATYAPVWADDKLLFTSTRAENGTAVLNRIYQAADTVAVSRIPLAQSAKVHQGAASLSPDGNVLFLTQWKVVDGKKSAAIYISRKKNNDWSTPVILDSVINTVGANTQQPFVMPDGKYLLFSSDKAGGQGGYDLWYAALDANGKALYAKNMGTGINTIADEQAPYFHTSSGTLVFSSNGGTGMGGYDLYYSKGNIEHWETSVNFGYPVNAVKDDIYFASKSHTANILEDVWFSSDRSAECCLELFSLQMTPPPPPPPVVEEPVVKKDTTTLVDTILRTRVNEAIAIQQIYYELNEYTLSASSYPALDKLADVLLSHPQMEVEISAHTDSTGTTAFNQQLSEKRAMNCVAYLISKGVPKNRLQYKGYGSSKPVAPNTFPDGTDNPEGRRLNRRIELKILKQ